LIFTLVYNKRIRIIHSHGFATALISGILGKIFKKKSIVSLHTIYKFSQKPTLAKVAKKILDSNIKILAISKGCKNDLLQIGIAKEKIIIYSYWINTSHFKPLEKSICRRKLGLSKSEFIALFVGRFTLEKQLLEALRVAQLTPKTTFLFIGQGPLSGKVKESEEKFNNISAIGKVDNLNLPLYYNSADVLLLGSVDEDYFGKTTMEALSSGLPVIISDRSCYFGQLKKIKSEILPENCGFIIKLDIQAISSKLHYLDQNRQELKLMKENCREFAIEHFSEKNAKIILQAYE
jgi:glycosyltransferase involved in cell wall biosynthesis